MNFRTQIDITPRHHKLSHSRPILMLGSCFTDSIGHRLQQALFNVVSNPFGPLYNPLSIAQAVKCISAPKQIDAGDLFCHNNLWHSWMFHSSYSHPDCTQAASAMTESVFEAAAQLQSAGTVFITLGATRAFVNKLTHSVVANCHKIDPKQFSTTDLNFEQTLQSLREIIDSITTVNTNANIIFTVSPIRHTAYGLEANSLSKAILRVAISQIQTEYENADYFPSYEIMLDDLRDYRFYAADMKHPTDTAVDYIYQLFAATYFSPETSKIAKESETLTRLLSHRPLHSKAQHDEAKQRAITALLSKYPQLQTALTRFSHHERHI